MRNEHARLFPRRIDARSSRRQHRYWEHTIRGDQDDAVHMDDIHFNPARHRLAAHPADWPPSSFTKCVMLGTYPIDWAIEGAELADAGERL
jgi:putative transposase